MAWGIFKLEVNGVLAEVHVIPCDAEGNRYPEHSTSQACSCHPTVEPRLADWGRAALVIHNQIN